MKRVLMRFLIGASTGILLGYLVNLIISLGVGKGEYEPAMPQLVAYCGTELRAVLVQTLLTALIGVGFAEAGFLFLIDRWSFLKQCVVHFFATMAFYLPFALLCWFPVRWESIGGILCSILATYSITYLINYRICQKDVEQINRMVQQNREDGVYDKGVGNDGPDVRDPYGKSL